MISLKSTWDSVRAFIIAAIFIGFFNILLGGLLVGSVENRAIQQPFSDMVLEIGPINYLLIVLLCIATTHFLYTIYSRKVSKKEMTPFKRENTSTESILGILIAFMSFSLIILIMYLSDILRFTGVNLSLTLIIPVALSLQAAYSEELVFRGILYRRLYSTHGHTLALILSSSTFGLLHLFNPGATILSTINIIITAGVILGAGYAITGRIWFSFFFHLTWNATQGAIYGQPISGIAVTGLFVTNSKGSSIFTGGNFGPEGSIFTTIILLPLSILLLYILYNGKKLQFEFMRDLDQEDTESPSQE